MRTFVIVAGAIVGFMLIPAAGRAQSAKPADPSVFGRVVSEEAVTLGTVGQNVRATATTTDFGVADEIDLFKELFGGTPTPPGTQ